MSTPLSSDAKVRLLLSPQMIETERQRRRAAFVTLFPDSGPLGREFYPKHLEFFAAGATYKERLCGRLSKARTLAALLPSRAPTPAFAPLAPFWLLGRPFPEVARFPDLGFVGATRRARGATRAPLAAFGCCVAAAASALACSPLFDVIVFSWFGKMPDQDIHPSDVAARQATLCDKTPRISLNFLRIIP